MSSNCTELDDSRYETAQVPIVVEVARVQVLSTLDGILAYSTTARSTQTQAGSSTVSRSDSFATLACCSECTVSTEQ
jgi:hypothetical protein